MDFTLFHVRLPFHSKNRRQEWMFWTLLIVSGLPVHTKNKTKEKRDWSGIYPVKAIIHSLTQSCDSIGRYGKPVELINKNQFKTDFNGPLHWFPAATDLTTRLSQKVDRGLYTTVQFF